MTIDAVLDRASQHGSPRAYASKRTRERKLGRRERRGKRARRSRNRRRRKRDANNEDPCRRKRSWHGGDRRRMEDGPTLSPEWLQPRKTAANPNLKQEGSGGGGGGGGEKKHEPTDANKTDHWKGNPSDKKKPDVYDAQTRRCECNTNDARLNAAVSQEKGRANENGRKKIERQRERAEEQIETTDPLKRGEKKRKDGNDSMQAEE